MQKIRMHVPFDSKAVARFDGEDYAAKVFLENLEAKGEKLQLKETSIETKVLDGDEEARFWMEQQIQRGTAVSS